MKAGGTRSCGREKAEHESTRIDTNLHESKRRDNHEGTKTRRGALRAFVVECFRLGISLTSAERGRRVGCRTRSVACARRRSSAGGFAAPASRRASGGCGGGSFSPRDR